MEPQGRELGPGKQAVWALLSCRALGRSYNTQPRPQLKMRPLEEMFTSSLEILKWLFGHKLSLTVTAQKRAL